MNIFKNRYSNIKQNCISIICVSAVQIWFNFKFPAFIRRGTFLHIIFGVTASIITTFVCLYVFAYPERYKSFVDLEYLDDAPEQYRQLFKDLHRALLISVIIAASFYFWYTDYYGMSNTWYIILYAYWFTAFALMIRAIKRSTK